METKLIGFICLVFVLMLVATNFHDVQGSEMEVQPPDPSAPANPAAIGVASWVPPAMANPRKHLSLPRGLRRDPRRLGKRDRDQLRCANRFPRTIVHVRSPRRTRSLNLHEKRDRR